MDSRFEEFLDTQLGEIRAQGLFKEEWPLLGPQGSEIRVGIGRSSISARTTISGYRAIRSF